MTGKSILAVLLGAITHFLLGFIIYGLFLMDFMQANTISYDGLMREDAAAMSGYIISSILFATLITYFLSKSRIKTATGGLVSAAVLSFLIAASLDAMFYFGMNLYTVSFVLVDIIAFSVMGSLTGLVVGLVLVRGRHTVTGGARVA